MLTIFCRRCFSTSACRSVVSMGASHILLDRAGRIRDFKVPKIPSTGTGESIVALKPAHLQWPESGDALHSADFGDIYFQSQQGPAESYYVFLEKNRLPERFAASGAAKGTIG